MTVAGVFVVLLGTGFIIVAVVVFVWRLQDRRLVRHLRRAPRATCATLGAGGRLPRSVLVTGVTAAGPGGLLRSPAYDKPCVWFRTDVIAVDDDSVPHEAARGASRALFRRGEKGPISLTDPTGTVLVELKIALRGSMNRTILKHLTEDARLSRAHRAAAGSGMARLEQAGLLPSSAYGLVMRRQLDLREEFIEPGREASVWGRPRRTAGGAIILGRRGALSPDKPDTWIEKLEAEIVSGALLLRLFPIGIVVSVFGVALIVAGVH